MSNTAVAYVQQNAEGTWRITDSRVALDSVVHAYWGGKSPEAIAEEFPTLCSHRPSLSCASRYGTCKSSTGRSSPDPDPGIPPTLWINTTVHQVG